MFRVQRVADLVQRDRRIHQQLSVLTDRSLLEKVPNFVATFDKVPVPALARFGVDRAEHLAFLLGGIFVQVFARFEQLLDLVRGQKVIDDGVTVLAYLKVKITDLLCTRFFQFFFLKLLG